MKKILSAAVASAVLGSGGANASVSEAEFAELKAQFAAMAQRLSALEAENNQLRELSNNTVSELEVAREDLAVVQKQSEKSSWTETIKWKGDFRYRYEEIEQDGRNDRDRDRIRARAELQAKPTDTLEVGLGLATGGDDPVSTNQTLGGGGSTKDIKLDLAYLKWTGLEDTAITAGKFKNPYIVVQKNGLIWDDDFRPEGAAVQWASGMFFANASYSFIESDTNNDDDGFWGIQGGVNFPLFDSLKLTASAGYLDFPTKGRPSIYDGDFFGNSTVIVDGEEVYEYDYHVYTGSLGLGFQLFDMPLIIFGDYAHNDDADDYETGYVAGITVGKAKNKGSWQFQYQYEKLEANATLGLVSDSDFMGGGTDGKGSKLSAKYMLNDKWYLGATYFDGDTGVNLGDDASYQRLQLDTGIKY
jgi:hypothetical protein